VAKKRVVWEKKDEQTIGLAMIPLLDKGFTHKVAAAEAMRALGPSRRRALNSNTVQLCAKLAERYRGTSLEPEQNARKRERAKASNESRPGQRPDIRAALVAIVRDALIEAAKDPDFRASLVAAQAEALSASLGQMASTIAPKANGNGADV
jgi:hypothetical protein